VLSSIERQRLVKAMNVEPAHPWMVVARCVAGLAVIVLIAVIGVSENSDRTVDDNVASVASQKQSKSLIVRPDHRGRHAANTNGMDSSSPNRHQHARREVSPNSHE
jgi:hypothetical protein